MLLIFGFIGTNEQNLLLKGEFTKIIDGKANTSKQFRREAVENSSADGIVYTIVVVLGDNLNDLDNKAGSSNRERRNYVTTNNISYGIIEAIPETKHIKPAQIILPNPMYGAWEVGLYKPA
ncbi:MAG: hypothetical protein F6K10_22070 [Moorea sp. SIO2B7]|nr:hypothetical protein [Moorena sp. SIO2B7]